MDRIKHDLSSRILQVEENYVVFMARNPKDAYGKFIRTWAFSPAYQLTEYIQ